MFPGPVPKVHEFWKQGVTMEVIADGKACISEFMPSDIHNDQYDNTNNDK